jgi:hypothetical protein
VHGGLVGRLNGDFKLPEIAITLFFAETVQ